MREARRSVSAAGRDPARPTERPPCPGRSSGQPEHVDVLVVGAGLSGVCAGHNLAEACPWAEVAILEARGAIGGTWDLFRFPGVRSDSDMFTLGYSFRPWGGERTIAEGAAIRDYIRETAELTGVAERIRFHHRVLTADWSREEARWQVTAERVDTGEIVGLTAAFLFVCAGYYRYDRGHLPAFPGQERFEGRMVHPQFWPPDLDYRGQRVVVIGSGATAVTLAPVVAEQAAHVTMLQRSPSYVAALPTNNPLARLVRQALPPHLAARVNRWLLAALAQVMYQACRRWPDRMRKALVEGVRERLPDGYDVATHFTPTYDPWDQRMCIVPDGDLFAAITAGRVSVVTDRLSTFTERGVELASGAELAADIVVAATGLELEFAGGIRLSVDGQLVDPASRLVYRGALLEGVPNFAFVFGYTNASWTLKCELSCQYVARLLNQMRTSGARQCVPVCRDDSVERGPFLDLASGYVRRGVDRLPSSGSRSPWRVHQNYFRDYRLMKSRGFDDALEFSSPSRAPVVRSEPGVAAPVVHH